MREHQCPLCRDTGIREEPRQLFITGSLLVPTPGTFCSCYIAEEKWKEVVERLQTLREEAASR
ncbi:MAG: hypothetical protein ACREDR_14530 [Blastocatellia bacterium]